MTDTRHGSIETASGKAAPDENFPVGSFLIARNLRLHVAAFYALARATDDIADNPDLSADEKLRRLDLFDAALTGRAGDDPVFHKAHAVARGAERTGVPVRHASDLLKAFRQDAVKNRYATWEELMGYCDLSAAPVGRFLLDLHGEDAAHYRYSDPLCSALQVLNHLQDIRKDYTILDRVYLPADRMEALGVGLSDLSAPATGPGLRALIDSCLDECDMLIAASRPLISNLRSRRLAMESATIVHLAGRLAQRLRRGDPLARRIAPGKLDFILSGCVGVFAGICVAGRA